MKKILANITLIFIICLITPFTVLLASDITDASYRGIIQATNNGTLAEDVAANFSLGTDDLIASGQLNSGATNVVARDQNGNDIPFMPGYTGNPWIIYYGSILAGISQSSYIYTGNVSGGLLSYFPGPTGMSVPDTLTEPGNEFELRMNNTFIDTTQTNTDIISHYDSSGGIVVSVESSGNIQVTAGLPFDPNNLSYDGTNDYCSKDAGVVAPSGNELTIEAWFYRDRIGVEDQIITLNRDVNKGWELYINATNKICWRVANVAETGYVAAWTSTNATVADTCYNIVATYKNGVGAKVYLNSVTWGGTDTGTPTSGISVETINLRVGTNHVNAYDFKGDIDEIRVSTVARTQAEAIYHYNGGVGIPYSVDANTISLWHFKEGTGATVHDEAGNNDLAITDATWATTTPVVGGQSTVSLSGVSSGEKDLVVTLSGGTLTLDIDGTTNTTAFAGNVPNSTAVWYFGSENVTPYIGRIEYDAGGVPVSAWPVWEYGLISHDLIGANDGTMSFRTTSSDIDVTASLISFLPLNQAMVDPGVISSWPSMVTDAPDQPSTMYTENTSPGIFFAPFINAIWPVGIPVCIFWYNFTFAIILLASIGTFYFFASKGQNALLLKCIVATSIMIFWALPGPNVYGFYVVIYHIFWCFGIIVLSRNYGW